MGSLYIRFSSADDARDFIESTPGFEYVPGADVLEAVYGDEYIDRLDSHLPSAEQRVSPRCGMGMHPAQVTLNAGDNMPKPWPSVIGYDGMPHTFAGIAMKAENGRWVPVTRFDPPLPDSEQANANARAESAHTDRCAEYAVKGAA